MLYAVLLTLISATEGGLPDLIARPSDFVHIEKDVDLYRKPNETSWESQLASFHNQTGGSVYILVMKPESVLPKNALVNLEHQQAPAQMLELQWANRYAQRALEAWWRELGEDKFLAVVVGVPNAGWAIRTNGNFDIPIEDLPSQRTRQLPDIDWLIPHLVTGEFEAGPMPEPVVEPELPPTKGVTASLVFYGALGAGVSLYSLWLVRKVRKKRKEKAEQEKRKEAEEE